MGDARAAIEALIYGYAERLDAGDFDGVAALFADATYRSAAGASYRGHEQVRAVLERVVRRHADGTPRTKHVTTNVVITIDDATGTADARAYFTVLQATTAVPLQPIVAGRYQDRFVRQDGVWRFEDRLIFMDLTGDLSDHLQR